MPTLGQDFGRLFEVGFNAGVLTAMQQQQLSLPTALPYVEQLRQLRLTPLIEALASTHGIASETDRRRLNDWLVWYVAHGWLAGQHLWQEYLQALGERTPPQVLYFHAQFTDENSLHTVRGGNTTQRQVLQQIAWPDLEGVVQRASARGHFLHADSLIWLRCRDHDRLLVIDLSTFQTAAVEHLADPQHIESARTMLLQEIAHLRTKSIFADLSLDLDTLDISFAEGLRRVLTGVSRRDKEVAKLIQAGSYAASFLDYADEANVLAEERPVLVSLVGYSDRGVCTLTVDVQHQRQVLDECATIYRRRPDVDAWNAAHALMEQMMQATAARTLGPQGRHFVDSLLATDRDDAATALPISYTEQLTDFANVTDIVDTTILQQLDLPPRLTLRDAHARLIHRALAPDTETPLVVLSGHPGIGKTTAIIDFLRSHAAEGFVFLYVSPRTQVNEDVIASFLGETTRDDAPEILALTTTSDLIRIHRGRQTVAFRGGPPAPFERDGVLFVPFDHDDTGAGFQGYRPHLKRARADTLRPSGNRQAGVLASMGAAIGAVLRHNLARQVVATVSIQSLKQTARGTTLQHLRHIFAAARNSRTGTMNAGAMQRFAQERRHFFIMIDEIAGDPSGPAFYHAVETLLREDRLLGGHYGFNTKLIIADASLTTREVIQQHLARQAPERPTVYVRRAAVPPAPLTEEALTLRGQHGVLINANAYPAQSLTFTVKVVLHAMPAEDVDRRTLSQPHNHLMTAIGQDLVKLLTDPTTDQIIVYLQDKNRLAELVVFVEKALGQYRASWEEGTDYLLIHADVAPAQKRMIREQKQQVKVVFMTASASRGISFPQARHLLIGIPPFQVEQNLMEILQVLFRGRGGAFDTADKTVQVYFAERAVYELPAQRDRVMRDRAHTLLTMIMLLRTAILTRIMGSGPIGKHQYQMIPVGSRSVSAAGMNWSTIMTTLLRELQLAQHRDRRDQGLQRISAAMSSVLSQCEIVLQAPRGPETRSYLSALPTFASDLQQTLERGFDRLLQLPPLPPAMMIGSLLVVPLPEGVMDEHYTMRSLEVLRTVDPALEREMWAMTRARDRYTERLRTALHAALELIRELRTTTVHTQWVQQRSMRTDRYYVLPLAALLAHQAFVEYGAADQEEPEGASFRELLEAYVRLLYPVDQVLPLGAKYDTFPFLVIQSAALPLLRGKLFTDRQVMASTTFNVLNVLLAQQRA